MIFQDIKDKDRIFKASKGNRQIHYLQCNNKHTQSQLLRNDECQKTIEQFQND